MSKGLSCAVLLFIASAASAQQPATPTEQALGAKLMAEISAGLTCSSNMITAQAQLADLQKQVGDLKKQLAEAKP